MLIETFTTIRIHGILSLINYLHIFTIMSITATINTVKYVSRDSLSFWKTLFFDRLAMMGYTQQSCIHNFCWEGGEFGIWTKEGRGGWGGGGSIVSCKVLHPGGRE